MLLHAFKFYPLYHNSCNAEDKAPNEYKNLFQQRCLSLAFSEGCDGNRWAMSYSATV